jgi:hypothetical protein
VIGWFPQLMVPSGFSVAVGLVMSTGPWYGLLPSQMAGRDLAKKRGFAARSAG